MQVKKRKGFTLIELVIVVAILGVLAMIALPQMSDVTNDAKIKTFNSNCQVIVSAMGMYQAANQGKYPPNGSAMNSYINGGFASLSGKPDGATYTYTGASAGATAKFTASFKDDKGVNHTFTYPT